MKSNSRAAQPAAHPPGHPLGHPPDHPAAPARAGFLSGRWFSLRAAFHGVAYVLRTQPNAWIELAALAVVVLLAWTLGVTNVEWALLAMTIFGVLALEAINTAIEAVVDLVSPEYHPLARIAKDTAAGALVFAVIASIIVAAAIFVPRIIALI